MERRLGVGFIGSGFITKFHIRSWEAVRDADVRGVWSPNRANAEEAAALARTLRVGEAKAFDSIEAMVADESIDAIWICGPNFARIDNMVGNDFKSWHVLDPDGWDLQISNQTK